MRITVLCSDPQHPVIPYLNEWSREQSLLHQINIINKKNDLIGGDILFLVSCSEIIDESSRNKYLKSLVLHASDLPNARGWSPHIWQICNGAEFITVCLLEAENSVDTGDIWKKIIIDIPKDALWDEINNLLFSAEIDLLNFAITNFNTIEPTPQSSSISSSYLPKRSPRDSALDVNKSIAEQFNLIRICDPIRFPAYFDYLGHRYILKLEKINEY